MANDQLLMVRTLLAQATKPLCLGMPLVPIAKSTPLLLQELSQLTKAKASGYTVLSLGNHTLLKERYDVIIDFDYFTHLRKHEWDGYCKQLVSCLNHNGRYLCFAYSQNTSRLRNYEPKKRKRQWNYYFGIFDRFFSKQQLLQCFNRYFHVEHIEEITHKSASASITYFAVHARHVQQHLLLS